MAFQDLCFDVTFKPDPRDKACLHTFHAFLRGFAAGRESAGAADLTHESGPAKPWSNPGH